MAVWSQNKSICAARHSGQMEATPGASGARESWAVPRAKAILPMYLRWFAQAREASAEGWRGFGRVVMWGLGYVWSATDRCPA